MHILFALLYLATVALSIAVAYDPALAWKPGGLLSAGALAMLGIAAGGRRWGDRGRMAVGAACALLAAAVGGYFLLRYDWRAAGAGKFAVLQQAGLWVQAQRPALPLPEDINGNVAGAALAVLLPLGIAGITIAPHSPAPSSGREGGAYTSPLLAGEAPEMSSSLTGEGPGVRSSLAGEALGIKRSPAVLLLRALCVAALAVGACALVLTGSRGAWAGAVAGGLVAGALAATARRWPARFKIVTLGVAAALFLAALGLTAAVSAWPGADRVLGGVTGADNSVLSRAQLWRDGLALIGDYPFTGSGAGSTMMVYSTYAMLLHVGYISHAHNLFLQIALEQGLPGLIAFLGLLALAWAAVADRSGRAADGWRWAAAAGLTALMVHGVADAGIYTSYLAPVLFVPAGLALGLTGRSAAPHEGASRRPRGVRSDDPTHPPTPSPRGRGSAASPSPRSRGAGDEAPIRPGAGRGIAIAVLAGLLALALLPPVRAAFQANLAALYQTRAELSVYRWPQYPIQDALRRQAPDAPPPVDLGPAIARYRAALALDPGNAAANRRLGQIELSQGDCAAARRHLEAAYAAAPWQRPARALLAEAYTLTGDPARAAPLWASVDLSQGQRGLRRWWYDTMRVVCRN